MKINKLMFFETGTYNNMVLRPYETNIDPYAMNTFESVTEGGINVSSSALASVASSILRPRAQHSANAEIANGWDTSRFRFILEVEYEERFGGGQIQFLTGYTDHLGANPGSGAVDQGMRLYFNNSIVVRKVTEHTPMGLVSRANVVDASHLISSGNDLNNNFGRDRKITMRPKDIFSTIEVGQLGPVDNVYDFRTMPGIENQLTASKRSNGAPSQYLSRTLGAYNDAMSANEGYGESHEQLLHTARGNADEATINNNEFFTGLNARTQFQENGTVTYGELCVIDPSIDARASFNFFGRLERSGAHSVGQTAEWYSADMETVASTILSQSVPAIMMDLMLIKVNLMATNDTIGSGIEMKVLGVNGFSENVDLTPYLRAFESRMLNEVLRDISRNGNIMFRLEMNVDLIGETFIRLSLDGNPPVDYIVPSFCDSLITPIVSRNADDINYMSNDLDTLMGEISDANSMRNANAQGGTEGWI